MQLLSDTTKQTVSAYECAGALLDALPGVLWLVRRHMRRHRTAGLSVPQFRTLVQLRRCPAASLFTIAERLGSSLPTTSRMVSGLVEHGLVERTSCTDDRRRVSLTLTERGQTVLEAALTTARTVLAERLAELPDAERAGLARSFSRLTELFALPQPDGGMEKQDDDASGRKPVPEEPGVLSSEEVGEAVGQRCGE